MTQTQMTEGTNLTIDFPGAITQTLYDCTVGYPTLHKSLFGYPSFPKIVHAPLPSIFSKLLWDFSQDVKSDIIPLTA